MIPTKKFWLVFLLTVMLLATSRAETILFTADLHYGDDAPYADEILSALLEEAQNVDALLILGDITNNGHDAEYQAVVDALQTAQEKGTQIFVLPGNHDVTKQNAAAFSTWYEDFGYRQAFSRDAYSLSYAVRLSPTLWLLMLDTCDYGDSNGFVRLETLKWASELYAEAEQAGALLVAAGHHPMLQHSYNDRNRTDSTINADAFARLLAGAQLPVYLAGHRHQLHYQIENAVAEILIGVPTLWPNKIGRLRIDSGNAHFDTLTLQPPISGFASIEKASMKAQARTMAISALQNTIHANDAEMIDFFEQIYMAYRDGVLYRLVDAGLQNPAYLRWQDDDIQSIFRPWLKFLLESMNDNYNQLDVPIR